MTTTLKTLLIPIVVLLAAAGSAQAQEATIEPSPPQQTELMTFDDGTVLRVVVVGKRMTTREAVLADLARYIAAGSPGSEAAWTNHGYVGSASRAEVMAELAQAKANGSFDSSGEHFVGHDARPSKIASAQPALRVASIR